MTSIPNLFVLWLLLLAGFVVSQDIEGTFLDSENLIEYREERDVMHQDYEASGEEPEVILTSTASTGADVLKQGDGVQLKKIPENAAGPIFLQRWNLSLTFVLACTCKVVYCCYL